jgi:hypothetical protein
LPPGKRLLAASFSKSAAAQVRFSPAPSKRSQASPSSGRTIPIQRHRSSTSPPPVWGKRWWVMPTVGSPAACRRVTAAQPPGRAGVPLDVLAALSAARLRIAAWYRCVTITGVSGATSFDSARVGIRCSANDSTLHPAATRTHWTVWRSPPHTTWSGGSFSPDTTLRPMTSTTMVSVPMSPAMSASPPTVSMTPAVAAGAVARDSWASPVKIFAFRTTTSAGREGNPATIPAKDMHVISGSAPASCAAAWATTLSTEHMRRLESYDCTPGAARGVGAEPDMPVAQHVRPGGARSSADRHRKQPYDGSGELPLPDPPFPSRRARPRESATNPLGWRSATAATAYRRPRWIAVSLRTPRCPIRSATPPWERQNPDLGIPLSPSD